jgi:hypothetical protein
MSAGKMKIAFIVDPLIRAQCLQGFEHRHDARRGQARA